MRRLWLAAGLLVLLLAASLTNGWYAQKLTGGMREDLRQAQHLAGQEDWSRAEAVTRQVYEDWQSHHFYFHTLMRTVIQIRSCGPSDRCWSTCGSRSPTSTTRPTPT